MKKILVVDDEEKIIEYLGKFLAKKGFEVFKARDGKQALEIMDKEVLDLLVLDERMPVLNGSGVLKGMAERKIHIPVIVISGSPKTQAEIDVFKSVNCEDILFKPVDLNIILQEINKKLGKRG